MKQGETLFKNSKSEIVLGTGPVTRINVYPITLWCYVMVYSGPCQMAFSQ